MSGVCTHLFFMNVASKKFCLVVASAALAFAGCSKKPTRPDPASTVLGQAGVGGDYGAMNPLDVPLNLEAPGLSERLDGFDPQGFNRSALEPVYFDFDKSDIKATERSKLQAAKDYLDLHPTHRVLLEGHCDWRGTAEYNLGLGDRRANSARQYLQSLGVTASRIETVSKGSLEASTNADSATMARERRVDLVVVDPNLGTAPF